MGSSGSHVHLPLPQSAAAADSIDRFSAETLSRVLGLLFLAGAITGGLTLLLPHSGSANDEALWSNVAIAALAGSVTIAIAPSMRPWILEVAVAFGTLAITRAVYYAGDAGSFYGLWYVWAGLFAFFAFPRPRAVAQLVLIGVAYGAALTQLPANSSIVRWLMTVGTVAIGGALVSVLAGRLRSRAQAEGARARALEVVSEAAHELGRRATSEEAGETLCRVALAAASGAASTCLWQPSLDGRGLVVTASSDTQREGREVQFVESGSVLLDAFTTGRQRFLAGEPGVLLQPLVLHGVTVGVLTIRWAAREKEPSEELRRVAELLSLEGALALERAATLARLERVARTDDLTGLANRRAWDEQLVREIARARRTETPLAIALIDLDDFKEYNDVHGHPAGDRLLKQVSGSWSRVIRATDILARYGGDEFAIALPATEESEAIATVERMRTAMPDDQRTSAGLVFWDGGEDEAELIARADRALYAAKAAGRDRVTAE